LKICRHSFFSLLFIVSLRQGVLPAFVDDPPRIALEVYFITAVLKADSRYLYFVG
jgi:hypothetical protein